MSFFFVVVVGVGDGDSVVIFNGVRDGDTAKVELVTIEDCCNVGWVLSW